jgi:hypothetical protein
MNCPEFREWLDDLLLRDPDDAPPSEIAEHLNECDDCAREHALALETLQLITPGALVVASPRLKQRILDAIPAAALVASPSTKGIAPLPIAHPRRRRAVRVRLAIALAAAAVLAMILFPIGVGPLFNSIGGGGALSLLAQAEAAEARLFAADATVSLTSEIFVEPVDDAVLIEARWLPMVSYQANGKERFDQLKLGGRPAERYTIRDESWYDPATHRFAHILSLAGRPLYANSFDGRSVHLLELDTQGRPRIQDEEVTREFQPPKSPAEFLGILAYVKTSTDDPGRRHVVHDDGPTKLPDGTPAHVLRLGFVRDESNKLLQVDFRVTIRDDNHRVESISEVYQGRTLFTIRHSEATGRPDPECGWDLAGLKPAIEKDKGGARSPVQILADMLRPSVTVDEMAKRADYPVYALGRDPSWSERRQIVDMLDLPSPPHRMFAAVYPAKDKRHVVFVQAHTFNTNLGPEAHAGKLIYTSPAGIKVWDDKNSQKMAEILLSSMGSTGLFSGPPARDRTCYLLETPEGTFPALAINGTLTDAELHGLVDSLERARPK